jgi:hypothetical protein
MSKQLINDINGLVPGRVDYLSYDITMVVISVGAPVIAVEGWNYVWARHNQPQTRLVMSLGGNGVFVGNRNQSGMIEIGIMGETASSAGIQALEMTGIPLPIHIADGTTGGTGFVLGTACRQVGTPEWRREKIPGMNIFTFATDRLIVSPGLRLSSDV